MRGGGNIGTGSDGCVFNVQFDASGTAIPESKAGAKGIATKVFVSGPGGKLNPQATNEYAIMMKVRAITNGLGVAVAYDNTLRQIETIDAEERASIPPGSRGACAKLTDETKPYTTLELPLVMGHMEFRVGGYSEESFTLLKSALEKMAKAKLTQLDLATRNVFYDIPEGRMTLILGDFGNGMDLSTENRNAQILAFARFVKHYGAWNPDTVSDRDGVHYRGYLYMIATVSCYLATRKGDASAKEEAWKKTTDLFATFKDGLGETFGPTWRMMNLLEFFAPARPQYTTLTLTTQEEEELAKALEDLETLKGPEAAPAAPAAPAGEPNSRSSPPSQARASVAPVASVEIDDSLYAEARTAFITKWKTDLEKTCDEIIALGPNPDVILDALTTKTVEEVLRSDMLMYEFLHAIFVDGTILDRLTRLTAAWFPDAAAPVVGAKRRRTYRRKQQKRVKMSRRR